MAASEPASAENATREHSSARNLLGVVFACILAASCSASDSDAQLSLAPLASPATSAPESTGPESVALRKEQTPQPEARPQRDPQAAQPVAAAETVARQAASAAPTEQKNQAAAADRSEAQDAQPAQTAGAVAETVSEPRKRGFLAGLFSATPATAAVKQAPAPAAAAKATEDNSAGETSEVQASVAPAAPAEAKAATAQPEATQGQDATQVIAEAASTAEKPVAAQKRGFLSAFFSSSAATPQVPFPDEKAQLDKGAVAAAQPKAEPERAPAKEEPSKPVISLASTSPAQASMYSMDTLPGVRPGDQLFEIRLGSLNDDGDVDVYEQEEGYYQVASAAGLARLAPNGLLKQRESVDVSCFKPKLVYMLKSIERHFGKRIVVTSGYRSPAHNRRVRGAPKSQHMNCAAADIVVEGVSKWELARFARSIPNRGGVGTYCHNAVHVDVGPERDWNWRCGRRG